MNINFGFPARFDHSFLCMNLPYTMSAGEAANATTAFNPKVVTPYHYRNADNTFTNLTLYTELVAAQAPAVKVRYHQCWQRHSMTPQPILAG
jgi:L-ascorbate metabolism protein UlaG (beta-lactamase superfamily)